MKSKLTVGIKQCEKCEYYLRCEECCYYHYYKKELPKLKQQLAEKDNEIKKLEEQLKNAIVPKFEINQIVYIVDKYFNKIYELKITSIRASRFKDKHFNSISYDGHLEESLFATEEEAIKKLQELKGNKDES